MPSWRQSLWALAPCPIPQRCVMLLPVWPMRDPSPPLSAAALGTLDFSLLYDQENNALHCTISKAKVGRRLPVPAGSRRRAEAEGQSSSFLTRLVVSCCVGAGQGGSVCLNHLSCPQKPCRGRRLGKKQEQREERMGGWRPGPGFQGTEPPQPGRGLLGVGRLPLWARRPRQAGD